MNGQPEKVVLTDALSGCHAAHSHHVHHRDFPEVHVEGLTPGDAAIHLADRLTTLLDSVAGARQREQVEHAIADVRAYLEHRSETCPESAADTAEGAPGPLYDARPLGDAIPSSRSSQLFRSSELELVRIVMPRDKRLPMHQAHGEATVHCLEGRVEFTLGSTDFELGPGRIVHLRAGEPHAVKALEDSSLLVTIVRK